MRPRCRVPRTLIVKGGDVGVGITKTTNTTSLEMGQVRDMAQEAGEIQFEEIGRYEAARVTISIDSESFDQAHFAHRFPAWNA